MTDKEKTNGVAPSVSQLMECVEAVINRQQEEIDNLKKALDFQQSVSMERHFEIKRLKGNFAALRRVIEEMAGDTE